ncbi:MAG TPA: hypothetical protein PK559_10005 [Ignavibacteriaceae bacterium]|nr:hypothetical protein [Ignavibacteriaceae bacterium]
MKKISITLFLLLYFLSTTGLTLVTHYCGGEVDSISLFRVAGDDDPCGCEGNSCCDPCCEDEVLNIKINDSHLSDIKVIKEFAPSKLASLDESFYSNFYSLFEIQTVHKQNINSNSPPLYLQNSVFQI